MAKEGEKKGKGSCLLWLIIGVVLVVLILSYGKHMHTEKTTGLASHLQTPADAGKYYIKMVRKVKNFNVEDIGIGDLLQVVTKSDKKWYMDNQSKIYRASRGSFNDFIGYNPGTTVEESLGAMLAILAGSPDREDALIVSQQEGVDRAVLEIEQGTAYGGKLHYTMELKKEGGLWKVDGFCGAREELERQIAALPD